VFLGFIPWVVGMVYYWVLQGRILDKKFQFNPFNRIPTLWTGVATRHCWIKILGTKIKILKKVSIDPGDRVFLTTNHPTTGEIGPAYGLYAHSLNEVALMRGVNSPFANYLSNRRVGAVMATKNQFSPIGGFLSVLGTMISINRDKRAESLQKVQQRFPLVFTHGTTMILHPDTGRPKPKSMASDHKKFSLHAHWLKFTRQPRSGSELTILHTLFCGGMSGVRVFDVTWGFGILCHTIWDLEKILDKTFYVEVEELCFEDIPLMDERQFQAWQNKRYRHKNELLGMWGGLNSSTPID